MNSAPPIRAAIIGISGYGQVHLGLAREAAVRGLQLTAAVVINPADEAARVAGLRAAGCRLYDDYKTMLAAERGRLELCLIPTGIAWHSRMTVAALRAGANVLVEKPLAGSSAEITAIRAAAAAADRFVAVGFQDIYEPAAHSLKRRLLAGAIGRLREIRMLGLWPRPPEYFRRNTWSGRLRADGRPVLDSPLNNAFAHFVNLALFLAGTRFHEAAAATAVEGVLWRTNPIESFDTGVVRARTAAGVRLWFGASHACATTSEPELLLVGDAGRAHWRHEAECIIEPASGSVERFALPPTSASRSAMMRAVLDRLHDPRAFICTPALARPHTALIERLHTVAPIRPAPGESVLRPRDGTGPAILCSPEAERRLRAAYLAGVLPV